MNSDLTLLATLPITAVSWAFGSVAVMTFGLKSWRRYVRTRNAMTGYFAWFGLILGFALGLYGFPPFFTLNTGLLRIFYLAADLLVFASLIVQAKILWHIRFRNINIFPLMATMLILAAGVAWYNELQYSVLFIEDNIVKNMHQPFAANIRGTIFGLLLLPLGYFFIRKGTDQENPRGKLKSVALGLAYFLIGISACITEFVYRGVDTREGMIANLIVFIIFFVVIIWPSKTVELKT